MAGAWEAEDEDLPPALADELGGPLPGVQSDVFPVTLATAFIRERFTLPDGSVTLHQHRGDFYVFDGSAYRELSRERLAALTYRAIDGARFEDEGRIKFYHAKSAMVGEVLAALKAVPGVLLADELQPPCWIGGGEGRPDSARLLALRNGILNLSDDPPRLIAPTPDLFVVGSLGFDYAPDAPHPARWLAFLGEVLADPDSIRLARQWAGLTLTADTSFQKVLLLVGPKRSGKGTYARILTLLNGAGNVCAPTLATLGTNFGLASLMNKRLAIIGDARLSGRTDQAVVTERVLSISGEDAVSIDRKYRDAITLRLPTRLLMVTNELPNLKDASGALASRFIVLRTRRSFFGAEDRGLESALIAELPGILNWAIDGYRDLLACGKLTEPESSRAAMQELADLSSPVSAFVEDECRLGPGLSVEKPILFEWWRRWCSDHGINAVTSEPVFARDLTAACPGLRTERRRVGERRTRCWVGIALREGGGGGT
jgi:putative DNA primase/helicase